MNTKPGRKLPQITDFPPEEVTPAVLLLLEMCHQQHEEILALRDEIARLKGGNPRPPIKPSKLESTGPQGKQPKNKRRGKPKRRKTQYLEIHDEITVAPAVPDGSRFKGCDDFTVQDLVIRAHNTRYRLERWVTPDGETVRGQPPTVLRGGHFGPTLRAYILNQYHHAHVTQPLLLEQLREWGIEISVGQLNRMITEGHDGFHAEKIEVLRVGLQHSGSIHVDDTGARHGGRNGFCTHIGNDLFAFFASTDSKSRINFLELLRAGDDGYTVNAGALAYMRAQKLPQAPLAQLAALECSTMADHVAWHATLKRLGIDNTRHVRIATEGALLGTVMASDTNPDLVIVSDDAGQFNVLTHALCWIHAERGIHKLLGFNDGQRAALAGARGELWTLYQVLKAYKAEPSTAARTAIEARFETLCTTKTCFESLNRALNRLRNNRAELLRVLDYLAIALHNNLAENDIRDYVKKRKISGSTRSQAGRCCRDTFTSLKKTCRKQGISFWAYLCDRLTGAHAVPWLPSLIEATHAGDALAVIGGGPPAAES